jgi:protein-tyrosine phosphatase
LKYAVLFALSGAMLSVLAVSHGGYYWILLWPALSFLAISLAYGGFGVRVFGKRTDGTMATASLIVLLPYLIYLWGVWHVLRLFSREDSQNRILDDLTIGRRLLASELPKDKDIEVIVDLTCEFYEPTPIRTSHTYQSFPLLDGVAPTPESLVGIVRKLSDLKRHIYIRCAQGHGRTGLVTAALLLIRGSAADPAVALGMIQSVRPQVRLSRAQTICLEGAFALMSEDGKRVGQP